MTSLTFGHCVTADATQGHDHGWHLNRNNPALFTERGFSALIELCLLGSGSRIPEFISAEQFPYKEVLPRGESLNVSNVCGDSPVSGQKKGSKCGPCPSKKQVWHRNELSEN